MTNNSNNNESREELEKLHSACLDGNHKWEEERLTVCSVCGMYQDEYNDRRLRSE